MSLESIIGHSPHLKEEVGLFLADVSEKIDSLNMEVANYSKPVSSLASLLENNPTVQMYVTEMISQVSKDKQVVKSIPELLLALQNISTSAPKYDSNPLKANFFPISTLFVYMMMTPAGQAVFRMEGFKKCIRDILKSWCRYLDSPESRSVLNSSESGWLCPSSYERHRLDEYEIPDRNDPHWGYSSFNAFFHRQIKSECRPVAQPENKKVIVCPNDGTLYKVETNVKEDNQFWIKSQPYSLRHMLVGDELVERFIGGDVFQSFLDGKNYHRFRSPVDGTIKKIVTVEGMMFSNAETVGADLTAGTYSQAYMTSVNTRKMVFIECDDARIGIVCLIAVGISEVSSISISSSVGSHVAKGDEIGYFSYSGSSICLIFEHRALRKFTIDIENVGVEVGMRGIQLKASQSIALAN
jgi:phosphatidylserine decarboxylase